MTDSVVGLQTICAIKSKKLELMEVVRNCGTSDGPYTHNTVVSVGCCCPAVLQLLLIFEVTSQVHVSHVL